MEVDEQPKLETKTEIIEKNVIIFATNTCIKLLSSKIEMDGFGGGSVILEHPCPSEQQKFTFLRVSEDEQPKVIIG